MIRPRSKN